jgi:transketolase
MVWEGLQAAYILQKKGINCRVINLHTIKPIDQECIRMAAKECGRIVTVEEHQVAGGVGSAVAEVVVQHHPVPMCMIGVNDSFGESGQPEELLVKYGLNCSVIVDKILHFIQNT